MSFENLYYSTENIEEEFVQTYKDIERTHYVDVDIEDQGGWIEGLEGRAMKSMARTAREKIFTEIRNQFSLPVYEHYIRGDHEKINNIIVGLQSIDRIEFYNPDVLVAATIFKTSNQPLDKEGIHSFKRLQTVSDYNLYRYIRFLNKIKFKPRHG